MTGTLDRRRAGGRRRAVRRAGRPARPCGSAAIQTLGAVARARSDRATASPSTSSASTTPRSAAATRVVRPGSGDRRRRFDAVAARARRPRPRRVAARRLRRLHRLRRAPGPGAGPRPATRSPRRRRASSGCTSPVALPLLPGDRYVLRESGRSRDRRRRRGARRRAGAAGVARPGPTAPSTGWSPSGAGSRLDELEVLTGERRPPTLGPLGRRPGVVEALTASARRRGWRRPGRSGSTWPRSTSESAAWPDARPASRSREGRAWPAVPADPLAEHPFLAALEGGRRSSRPAPDGRRPGRAARAGAARPGRRARRRVLRARRPSTTPPPALPHRSSPDGPTASRWPSSATRSATTRKYALPLLAELDAAASPAAAATSASPARACPRAGASGPASRRGEAAELRGLRRTLQVAGELGHLEVVGDHLAERVGIGQQPASGCRRRPCPRRRRPRTWPRTTPAG